MPVDRNKGQPTPTGSFWRKDEWQRARDEHFLEEVAVGDDLELLEHEKDAALDEEALVLLQRLAQLTQVPLPVSPLLGRREGENGNG